LEDREARLVRIVAIDAVVALTRTTTPIPVAAHPTVRTGFPVAHLNAVTLAAESLDVSQLEGCAVSKVQPIRALRVVTGEAGNRAMDVHHPTVDLAELLRR